MTVCLIKREVSYYKGEGLSLDIWSSRKPRFITEYVTEVGTVISQT